jgi:predicted nucleotidyltransferase
MSSALILNDKRSLKIRIAEFLQAVNELFPIDKALLFGSTAKQTRHPDSDVDLIIVSERFTNLATLDRVSELLKLWPYVEDLELLTYTPREFELIRERLMVKAILSYAIDLTPDSNS